MTPEEKLTKLHKAVKVGDGITLLLYSDSNAYTIIKRTEKTLTIQRDRAIRTDKNGMSDCQSYRYEPNKNGAIKTIHWSNKHQRWNAPQGYRGIWLGRHEYFDYTF